MANKTTKILLRSSDDQVFKVDEIVAKKLQNLEEEVKDQAQKIKIMEKMFETNCKAVSTIILPNIGSETLDKIVKYYERQNDATQSSLEEDMKKFDDEFFRDLNNKQLLDICVGAHQLGTKKLLHLILEKIKDICYNGTSTIHLPDIGIHALARIVKYYAYKTYVDKSSSEKDLKKFEDEFLRNMNNKLLIEISVGAGKIGIRKLFDLTLKKLEEIFKDHIGNNKFDAEYAKIFEFDDVAHLFETFQWLALKEKSDSKEWTC